MIITEVLLSKFCYTIIINDVSNKKSGNWKKKGMCRLCLICDVDISVKDEETHPFVHVSFSDCDVSDRSGLVQSFGVLNQSPVRG